MMKLHFLISTVAVLHGVSADLAACFCGSFLRSAEDVNRPDLDYKIFTVPTHMVEDCDALDTQKNCIDNCVEKVKFFTGGFSLDFVTPYESVIGDVVCLAIDKDFEKREPAIFSKVCDGEWEFAKASDPPYLTCKDDEYVASN